MKFTQSTEEWWTPHAAPTHELYRHRGYLIPLTEAGILVETTNGARNRLWRSLEVLAALDAFAERACRRGCAGWVHAARGSSGAVSTARCVPGWLRVEIQPMYVRYSPMTATMTENTCHHGLALITVCPRGR